MRPTVFSSVCRVRNRSDCQDEKKHVLPTETNNCGTSSLRITFVIPGEALAEQDSFKELHTESVFVGGSRALQIASSWFSWEGYSEALNDGNPMICEGSFSLKASE